MQSRFACVSVLMWVCHIISSVLKAINNLLISPHPPYLQAREWMHIQFFFKVFFIIVILAAAFLMSVLNLRGLVQDDLSLYLFISTVCFKCTTEVENAFTFNYDVRCRNSFSFFHWLVFGEPMLAVPFASAFLTHSGTWSYLLLLYLFRFKVHYKCI